MEWDIKNFFLYTLITLIIFVFWIGLEYLLDGQVISQESDTLICFVLGYFITEKISNLLKKKGE